MTKILSRDLSKKQQKSLTGWDAAIADAERMINEAKETIETLKFSIHSFKAARDRGEPFPSEQTKQREAKAS
jgi:hypothetical protein